MTLTNTLFKGTVPPGKPTFLPRQPDTPLAAAVATVSQTPQEAELTPEERSEILRNLDQQQSWKKIGWMPEIPASRPSEKIDHTKCGPPVVDEPQPEAVTRLLEEFPDVFAELPKGLPKSRPTDHPNVVDETQTTPAHRLYRMPAADQEEIKRQEEELVAAVTGGTERVLPVPAWPRRPERWCKGVKGEKSRAEQSTGEKRAT